MVDEQVNNISKHVTHTFSWLSKLYGNDNKENYNLIISDVYREKMNGEHFINVNVGKPI